MRGRTKRLKTAPNYVAESSAMGGSTLASRKSQMKSPDPQEDAGAFQIEGNRFESGSFAARCPVRLIHDVVSNFDSRKRDWVKSTGFNGILHFPTLKHINRKFALWIMSCVDEESTSLRVGDAVRIPFNRSDVGIVFGIPSSGKRILGSNSSSREAKEKVINDYLGNEFKEHKSIKYLQEIICRNYGLDATKHEIDSFKVAFVAFVLSTLLSPSAKHDYVSVDCWHSLLDPSFISKYDWSGYVIFRLLEAVSKLKQDVSGDVKYPNITGCSLFLQVLYLDSLDLGDIAMPHNSFPRIREFSQEKISLMIQADNNFLRHANDCNDLPVTKLRETSGCIYSWAMSVTSQPEEPRNLSLLAIWEVACGMVRLLNIPLEAAGPIFVAAADFQDQINSGLVVNGMQALKFMSVIVSLMIPYSKGFSYESAHYGEHSSSALDTCSIFSNGIRQMSVPCRLKRREQEGMLCCVRKQQMLNSNLSSQAVGIVGHNLGSPVSGEDCNILEEAIIGDDVQRSINSAIASLDGVPHSLNLNFRVATVMSQYYNLVRKMKMPRGFDLNSSDSEESSSESILRPDCLKYAVLPSPWDLGYTWVPICPRYRDFIQRLHCLDDAEGLIIIHRSPKYIQVSACGIRAQFLGHCEFELDLFDAILRCVKQDDDGLYEPYGTTRWRYFFESDFMESILAGCFDLLDNKLYQHLSMAHIRSDLTKCKLMFFPVLLHCQWVCIVWCLESNVISVFEPSYVAPIPENRLQTIERSTFLLKLAMQTLSSSVFKGRSQSWMSAEMRILTLAERVSTRFNRSGALCALFCRCFDGVDFIPKMSAVDADSLVAKLLEDVLYLKGNCGRIPPRLVKAVCDEVT